MNMNLPDNRIRKSSDYQDISEENQKRKQNVEFFPVLKLKISNIHSWLRRRVVETTKVIVII